MKVAIKDIKGKASGEFEVNFAMIEDGRGTQAVHDVVVAYRAAQRAGTHSTKTMGEVAGTNKKPWRQKGTGRARAGSFRSPLWRGGGVTFGPKPRDYTKKVGKKTRQLALRKALTERLKAGDVIVVDDFKLESPKTKGFLTALNALDVGGKTTLIVSAATDKNLMLASRNVAGVELVSSSDVNTYQTLKFDKLVFTKGALEKVQERLS
jgi:large subunit ribosomal protein L4